MRKTIHMILQMVFPERSLPCILLDLQLIQLGECILINFLIQIDKKSLGPNCNLFSGAEPGIGF